MQGTCRRIYDAMTQLTCGCKSGQDEAAEIEEIAIDERIVSEDLKVDEFNKHKNRLEQNKARYGRQPVVASDRRYDDRSANIPGHNESRFSLALHVV